MKRSHRLLPWQRDAMVDAYLGGEKTEAIGAEFGVSAQYPGQLAKTRGHPVRPQGRPKRKELESVVLG